MSIMELGALGELLGAIAVFFTLVYLAVQVRQNTRSIEAAQRLALAQTYQMRSDALQSMLVQAAASDVGRIIATLTQAGYPERLESLDELSPLDRSRFRQWQIAQQAHWDNMHFQYQQGYLAEEYYRDEFVVRTRRLWPVWQKLGLTGSRRSFIEELERITAASAKAAPPAEPAEAEDSGPDS